MHIPDTDRRTAIMVGFFMLLALIVWLVLTLLGYVPAPLPE